MTVRTTRGSRAYGPASFAHVKARTIKVVRRGLRDGLMLEEIARFSATQTGDAALSGPAIRVPRSRRPLR